VPYRHLPDDPCALCAAVHDGAGVVAARDHAVIVAALRPRVDGSMLVAPRRHTSTFTDLTPAELLDIAHLTRWATERLVRALDPDGVGVGVDLGLAAEQPMAHVVFDVVPRYAGHAMVWKPYEAVDAATEEERRRWTERLRRA
jgi:ATP adenylyltransferase